jgi:hypothetical protein
MKESASNKPRIHWFKTSRWSKRIAGACGRRARRLVVGAAEGILKIVLGESHSYGVRSIMFLV